jgi:hypothetical protein
MDGKSPTHGGRDTRPMALKTAAKGDLVSIGRVVFCNSRDSLMTSFGYVVIISAKKLHRILKCVDFRKVYRLWPIILRPSATNFACAHHPDDCIFKRLDRLTDIFSRR